MSTAEEIQAESESPKHRLDQDVQITDAGPCKKHLKVTIARSEIDRQFNESLGTMKREAAVPGFRPGRAPKTLVEKRFRKQVSEQVKSTLLMASLEQLDEEYKLNPISPPQFDIATIVLPDEGPLLFEMDVEVQPEFPVPAYKALTVKVPVKTIDEADIDAHLKKFLEDNAQLVPKLEGGAAIGDTVIADILFEHQGLPLNESKEVAFRLQPQLHLLDSLIPNAGQVLLGVTPGEVRQTDCQIGSVSRDSRLHGQTVQVTFHVHDLKQLRLPEVDEAFLSSINVSSLEGLRQSLKEQLERRIVAQQRQAIRTAILDQLLAETPFDLPEELVSKQEATTLRRFTMELQQAGLSETEAQAREAEFRANLKEKTLRNLKEYFLLAKIAEEENIKVMDDDVNREIESIAANSDETPRRVRARVEKEKLGDMLATQILERKTLDRILQYLKFEEVPLIEQPVIETLNLSATTMTAVDESEAKAETSTVPPAEEPAVPAAEEPAVPAAESKAVEGEPQG